MLAFVCKTHDGLKALLTYDKKGPTNKCSDLHGDGASIGRLLDDRYLVICLENLRFEVMMISSCKCISYSIALLYSFFFIFGYHFRPYTGEFIADDP